MIWAYLFTWSAHAIPHHNKYNWIRTEYQTVSEQGDVRRCMRMPAKELGYGGKNF